MEGENLLPNVWHENDEERPITNGETTFIQLRRKFCPALTFEYWNETFDFTDDEILKRIILTLTFKTSVLVNRLKEKSDFYNPFWINITLIFFNITISNISNYLKEENKNKFSYDFSLIHKSIFIVFSFSLIIPISFLLCLKIYNFEIDKKLILQSISIYSYSNIFMIIGIILSIIPSSIFEVIFILNGCFLSVLFLLFSYNGIILKSNSYFKKIIWSIFIIGKFIEVLVYKNIFFKHHQL